MSTRVERFAYIKKQWDTEPDYPFAKAPETAIFRHSATPKMVRRRALGESGAIGTPRQGGLRSGRV